MHIDIEPSHGRVGPLCGSGSRINTNYNTNEIALESWVEDRRVTLSTRTNPLPPTSTVIQLWTWPRYCAREDQEKARKGPPPSVSNSKGSVQAKLRNGSSSTLHQSTPHYTGGVS